MPSTATRERPRSTGSSVRVVGLGQALQMPGGTAAGKVREAAEGLKRATSAEAVAQETEVAEGPRRATSVVGAAERAPLVGLTVEEASEHRAIEASRAEAQRPVVQEAWAVEVHRGAVAEDPEAAAVAAVAVAVVDVGDDL